MAAVRRQLSSAKCCKLITNLLMESVIQLMQYNIALYSTAPPRTSVLIKGTLA